MPKPIPTPYAPTLPPSEAEKESVHEVYEAIAPHFSLTRYKPWPLVSQFLSSLPPNTLGLDSGGGNGKYVPLASEQGREVVVLDMSWGLLSVARKAKGEGEGDKVECMRGELGYDGWHRRVFDWAISIAAIHHLSTPLRRQQSVQALLDALVLHDQNGIQPYSRFMIYVWAYEQGEGSKRKMGKKAAASSSEQTPQEDERSQAASSGTAKEDGVRKQEELGEKEKVQDVLVPWVLQPKPGEKAEEGKEPKVFHRYYHLFLEGELRELVEEAAKAGEYIVISDEKKGGGAGAAGQEGQEGQEGAGREVRVGEKWMRVVKEGWEADNWWLEGEVGVGPRRG